MKDNLNTWGQCFTTFYMALFYSALALLVLPITLILILVLPTSSGNYIAYILKEITPEFEQDED